MKYEFSNIIQNTQSQLTQEFYKLKFSNFKDKSLLKYTLSEKKYMHPKEIDLVSRNFTCMQYMSKVTND